jgi:hypothetical protein
MLYSTPIKLERVFLSNSQISVSSHLILFHQPNNARQLSNRYMFHAGRYLYDKEFCYLRTLIVRADVHKPKYWSHISLNL